MSVHGSRRRTLDIWPGFVDALASLLMVMVFVLLVFALGQFLLSGELSDREKALQRLDAQIAELSRALGLEKTRTEQLTARSDELTASLARTEAERSRLALDFAGADAERKAQAEEIGRIAADLDALKALKAELELEVARLIGSLDTSNKELTVQTELNARATAQVELLNRQMAALRTQLEEVAAALQLANSAIKDKDIKLAELGAELNLALAGKVRELNRYRSEFFGRLREALGERSDVQIIGDRFVFPSEILFASGSDQLGEEGLVQLGHLADTLRDVTAGIPADIEWVLQVDGHTDRRPIATSRFPSNWELSSARAVAIVKFLRDRGIPARRLAATGYGEYHPLTEGSDDASLARNRRIELKLTNR